MSPGFFTFKTPENVIAHTYKENHILPNLILFLHLHIWDLFCQAQLDLVVLLQV